ncbi:MAG: leucine-rich repeat domain-containing protein, partial [Clostridia bacterium]|nr:leucine-rich repeat domain-containing protein [Clostridia bacterium]
MKKNIIFKAILATLLLTLLPLRSFAATVNDYSFSAENEDGTTIYYNITSSEEDNYTVETTYLYEITSSSTSNSSAYTGDVVIPSTVEYEGITYSVTSIGEYTFCYCSKLNSIKIPSSVTILGLGAFHNCTSLTSIEIPSSVTSI